MNRRRAVCVEINMAGMSLESSTHEPETPRVFRVISLWQPWASLLAAGVKRIETRSWPTAVRGWVLVHAARHVDGRIRELCAAEPLRSLIRDRLGGELARGAIVGMVRIVDCQGMYALFSGGRHRELLTEQEQALGDFGIGRFGWVCRDARRFDEPIPMRGGRGFFKVESSMLRERMAASQCAGSGGGGLFSEVTR